MVWAEVLDAEFVWEIDELPEGVEVNADVRPEWLVVEDAFSFSSNKNTTISTS